MFSSSARIYDAVYSFKDYRVEAERVHELIQERSPGASSLLDVACGTGKHLEQFRRWYPDVAGLDLDEGLVEVARERLDDVPLSRADMASFDLGRTFDAVTCLFSSIGYVGTVERLTSAIAVDGGSSHAERGVGGRTVACSGRLAGRPTAPPDR